MERGSQWTEVVYPQSQTRTSVVTGASCATVRDLTHFNQQLTETNLVSDVSTYVVNVHDNIIMNSYSTRNWINPSPLLFLKSP